MGRPTPNVLFSQSFRHYHLGEHVDEVRFSEPVVITACEILEQQTASMCRSIALTGVSSPQSFSIEIFVRSGGDARFKRLCHAFLYSASAPALLDAQVAVTDHLVMRGTYDSLTLVVYGNLASTIGQVTFDRDLDSQLPDLLPNQVSFRFEDLPEALHPRRAKVGTPFGPLQYLQLVQSEKENEKVIQNVLQLAGQAGRSSLDNKSLHKVVKSLVSAAASLHISESRLPNVAFFDLWPAFCKPTASEDLELKKGLSLLLDAKKELREVLGLLQEKEMDKSGDLETVQERENMVQDDVDEKSETSDSVLELILRWMQGSVQVAELQTPLLPVEILIGGLSAAQLLCTDAQECYKFVLAGGLHILLDVLQHAVGSFSATTLLALGAVECASRYAFGCEALLGWWTPTATLCEENLEARGTCKGYSVLVKFLLRPQQRPIALLAARVLHRLRAYELTAAIQPIVEIFIKEPASSPESPREEESEGRAVDKATVFIKQLLRLVTAREVSVKEGPSTRFSHWLALDGDDGGTQLPPCAAYGASASTTSIISRQDIDPYLLSVLQERRLLPMLVTLLSAPSLRSLKVQAMKSCAELVGAIEALLLALLSCRSGLLFLAHDTEVSKSLLASFQRIQELHENDLPPLRHTIALTTAGFLCHPHDLGGMFQTCLSVISAMDRLLGASQQSEESLWALWDLCTISRLESERQALLILTWFPEVMTLLVGSFHSGPDISSLLVFGETWRRAAVHFVAEVLQVVVSDAAAPTVAAWTPYAVAMQRAILSATAQMDESFSSNACGYEIKDKACSGLLEWLDAAVVYHKKGSVGLLKYASVILSGGSGISQTASGLPSVDSMDVDANVGDQGVTNDSANNQAKWAGTEVTAAPLTDTATVQMTVAFRILALVSCYPGVATVLYGEGAMAVVFSVLEQCSTALQSSSSAYDATMDEEDMEFDGTAEDLGDHAKEHLLLGLLLPTVLFLLTLLQSLQAAVQNYQNTKLVDVLLALHQQMSFRIASYVSVPPYAWSGITQDFIAVKQVLASVLICWPIFGWTPPLFPRLLRLDNSSTMPNPLLPPMEPAATCSVLSLLVDMLPTECPQLCNSKSALSDMYRSLAVDNILGCQSASAVSWHTCSPHSDEFLQALVLYLDQIGDMVSQHTSTACGVLQDMLKLFIIRMACVNTDHAATVLRPILNQIREQSPSGGIGSEKETLQLEHIVQLVAGLALHPASKVVVLREGVVEILLNAFIVPSQSSSLENFNSTAMGRWLWIARAFSALCDPDVSLTPFSPLSRRIMEDCPTFGDCCSIASCLLDLLQVVPVGKDFEVVLEALEKLSSHKSGRTSIGYASVRRQGMTTSVEEITTTDSEKSHAANNGNVLELAIEKIEEHQSSIFGGVWRRIQSTLESNECAGDLVIGVILRFAKLAIALSAAGKSACGLAALSCLFGIGQGLSAEKSHEEKLEPVENIAATLRTHVTEAGPEKIPSTDNSCLSSVPGPTIQEAYASLTTMLRIIRRPEIGKDMIEKAILVVEGQTAAFAAHSTPKSVKQQRPDKRLSTALVWSAKQDVEPEKDNGNANEFRPETGSEISVLDSRGMIEWECPPTASQDRAVLPRSSPKRKAVGTIEVSRKRPGMDPSAAATPPTDGMGSTPVAGRGPLPASATSASVLNRRDTFRQRKPNTSRPPSMHVDDYVARERSEVVTSGTSPAPIQRSTSGSGRPPSIHVDEFMAKQQERQQLTGINDRLLPPVRNASLSSQDIGRKGGNASGLAQATNKVMSEEEGQRSTTPQDKGYEQQWEEGSVAESAAVGPGVSNEGVREPSRPNSASAPSSSTADVKSGKTSSSSSSISTTTDSVHSVKTPQVSDMLLLQSKLTLQTSVARNQAGGVVVQTHKEEIVQTELREVNNRISGPSTLNGTHGMLDQKASVPFHSRPTEQQPSSSRMPDGGDRPAAPTAPSTIEKASDSQLAKNAQQATSGSSSRSDLHQREAVPPMRGRLDHQNAGRETRQQPPAHSVHSGRQLKEPPTTAVGHSMKEPQANISTQPSPFTPILHHGPQTLQMNSPMSALEHRPSLPSIPMTDPSSGSGKGQASSASYATDPRPRPPEKPGERTAMDPRQAALPPPPPPPATPWRPDVAQSRLESPLLSPLVSLLAARQSAGAPYNTSLPVPMPPQWPPVEGIAKGAPLSNTHSELQAPWPVHHPQNTVSVDESGVPYGVLGRSSQQPSGNPPLPAGPSAAHHAMQFPTTGPSSLSPLPPHQGGIVSAEKVQSYNTLPSLLQPMSYVPPPLQAGRPTTSHAPSLPGNNPAAHQQQQLHLHFQQQQQQQNAMKLQQQQQQQQQQQLQQSRQHQLLQHQHAQQPQQMQQLHHQQHLLGPLPMAVHVPLPAPPSAPPAPPPPPTTPAPAPPQLQQRTQPQQESSAMLQQMLASPDAIKALLKDQNKLRELLEKHPKLIGLLQERMNQGGT